VFNECCLGDEAESCARQAGCIPPLARSLFLGSPAEAVSLEIFLMLSPGPELEETERHVVM